MGETVNRKPTVAAALVAFTSLRYSMEFTTIKLY